MPLVTVFGSDGSFGELARGLLHSENVVRTGFWRHGHSFASKQSRWDPFGTSLLKLADFLFLGPAVALICYFDTENKQIRVVRGALGRVFHIPTVRKSASFSKGDLK